MRASVLEVLQSARLWNIWLRMGIQDVQTRFRRSAIGLGWIFLQLSMTVLVIGFVYGNLLGQDMHVFVPYLTVSLVTWGYLTNSITEGGYAFVNSEGYIKQISLPIYVYVFRYFVSISLVSLISLSVFIVVAIVYAVPVKLGSLWVIPGLFILMLVSVMLIAIFAHINARFRDTSHLASVAMQVLFFLTPVIYPSELLRQHGLGLIIDLNPLYHLLQMVRTPLLFGEPAEGLSYVFAGAVILVLAGVSAFLMQVYNRRIVFAL